MIVYRLLIALVYAKSLFANQELIRCFELLQTEFIQNPSFVSLLYAFGKYAIKAVTLFEDDSINKRIAMGYLGTAIGALEECSRSQVKERYPRIFYYLAKAYEKKQLPV